MALAYFKLAIIGAGIAYRSREAGLTDDTDKVGEAVAPLIAAGWPSWPRLGFRRSSPWVEKRVLKRSPRPLSVQNRQEGPPP